MTDIYKILNLLEDIIDESPQLPFFSDKKLVNEKKFKDLLYKAIAEMPPEFARAKEILAHEQYIISSAYKKAEEIVNLAQQERNHLLAQSEIIRAVNEEAHKIRQQVHIESRRVYEETEHDILEAEKKAEQKIKEMLAQAQQEAHTIRESAYGYASFILQQMEKLTQGALDNIHNGQKQIESHAISNQNVRAISLIKNEADNNE